MGTNGSKNKSSKVIKGASIKEISDKTNNKFYAVHQTDSKQIIIGLGGDDYGQNLNKFQNTSTRLTIFDVQDSKELMNLALEDSIDEVCCGSYHTLLKTISGRAFGFGWSEYGQYGTQSVRRGEIVECILPRRVEKVKTKFNFSLFILDDHSVYVCGWNSYNVLGFENKGNITTLTRYPLPEHIKIVDGGCGGCSILLISDKGELYVSGWNSFGQLFMGTETIIPKPTLNTNKIFNTDGERPLMIQSGYGHTLILSNIGHCYVAGKNEVGQLGIGTMSHREVEPIELDIKLFDNELIHSIACGEDHSAFLTHTGRVYTCGSNSHGQLGLGHKNSIATPTLLTEFIDHGDYIRDMGCCGFSTVFITAENDVYISGVDYGLNRTDYNIVDYYSSTSPSPLKIELPKIISPYNYHMSVSCGRYHVMILCSSVFDADRIQKFLYKAIDREAFIDIEFMYHNVK